MPGPAHVSLCWRGFGVPKQGHSTDEYEDAFAADPRTGRFAIADGASESSFASSWARLLVAGFIQSGGQKEKRDGWLSSSQEQWSAEVDGRALPWYAETKRQQGAFATFLGLVVRRQRGKPAGAWRAMAVGDSCLFHVRADKVLATFPVTRSVDFGNLPALLCSRPVPTDQWRERKTTARGSWLPGDRLFLLTDALAQWFLTELEARQRPWQTLDEALAEPEAEAGFAKCVHDLRNRESLRNDDVTLVEVGFRV